MAAAAFGARVTGMPGFRGARSQFGGEFGFEAGAAVAEQSGHVSSRRGSGFSREERHGTIEELAAEAAPTGARADQ